MLLWASFCASTVARGPTCRLLSIDASCVQIGPAALHATERLLALQRQHSGPRTLLSAMMDRGIVKLLKLLQELVSVHPWCALRWLLQCS